MSDHNKYCNFVDHSNVDDQDDVQKNENVKEIDELKNSPNILGAGS